MKYLMMVNLLFLINFVGSAQGMTLIKLSETCQPVNMDMIKCRLADGVSADDAIDSMKLRANMLNLKLVGHLPLSEQVSAMGGQSGRMEIFQFCDAMIAAKMVRFSLAFAGYLPCRIALIEDEEGVVWLITLDMDKVMQNAELPETLQHLGLQVRNNIYNIISAGVDADL